MQAPLVVVPAQMEDSMDQEGRQFSVERTPQRLGLPDGRRQGDHHIAQQVGFRALSFALREGQHIGGLAFPAVGSVQVPDLFVPDQFDADFSPRFAHCPENLPAELCQRGHTELRGPEATLHDDGH
jgi:hypothetical protein